ncbi:hypothetical protein [Microlunatus endophyticus]
MRNPCAARSRFALVDALDAEWAELGRDRLLAAHSRAELAHWAVDHPILRDCASPAAVLDAIRSDPDRVLAALIGIHQSQRAPGTGAEDHLAGRIVLQAMLGKVVAMAGRDSRHAIEDYIGQLWARIDGYPLARRPRRIAANLALDTLKAVTRDLRAAGRTLPVTTDELELAGLARTVAGGIIAGPDFSEADAVADLTAHRCCAPHRSWD